MVNWLRNGTKVWVVTTEYNTVTIHTREDDARDRLCRKDKLSSFVVSEFREESVS